MNPDNQALVIPRRRHPILLYLFVLVLAGLAGQQLRHYQALHTQRLQAKAQIAHIAQLADEASVPAPTTNAATERRLAEMRSGFSVPWPALLAGLENSDQPTIALLAMEPDPKRRTLKLSGEAKTVEALQVYLDKLAGTTPFKKAYLLHQEVLVADQLDTIGFQLMVVW